MHRHALHIIAVLCIAGCATHLFPYIRPGTNLRVKLLDNIKAYQNGQTTPATFVCDESACSRLFAPSAGEVRIRAHAQGRLVDSRVLFRIEEAELIDKKLKRPLDGWIVGEDQINGLEGTLGGNEQEFYYPRLRSWDGKHWRVKPPHSPNSQAAPNIEVLAGRMATVIIASADSSNLTPDTTTEQ